MSEQTTSVHPFFQPRADKNNIAVTYMLWLMASKTFIKPSGCWYWGGGRSDSNYGLMEIQKKIYRVHRVIYEYCVADIPDGLLVLHGCDNPPCCNPSHLHVGDKQDNIIECLERSRSSTTILTPDDVREIRRLHTERKRRRKDLAERFGVSVWTINEVLSGRTWSFIT